MALSLQGPDCLSFMCLMLLAALHGCGCIPRYLGNWEGPAFRRSLRACGARRGRGHTLCDVFTVLTQKNLKLPAEIQRRF